MTESVRRLYRSSEDTLIYGICGGLADYFRIEVKVLRLAAVAVLFMSGGSAGLAYLIMRLVVPWDYEAPGAPAPLDGDVNV